MKSNLWIVLEKYDDMPEYSDFCDSVSNTIQNKETSVDVLNIFKNLIYLEKEDTIKIEESIGDKIDSLLFNI